jgi:hypothetical protein
MYTLYTLYMQSTPHRVARTLGVGVHSLNCESWERGAPPIGFDPIRGSSTGRTPHASGLVRLARLSRHAICSARFPPAESQAIPASKALNTWHNGISLSLSSIVLNASKKRSRETALLSRRPIWQSSSSAEGHAGAAGAKSKAGQLHMHTCRRRARSRRIVWLPQLTRMNDCVGIFILFR